MRQIPAAVAAAAVLALAVPSPAQGAIFPDVRWEMNEPAGSGTMLDSFVSGLVGDVGTDISTGAAYAGATGYRFPTVAPDAKPVRPEHTVVVPDNSRLDPGSGNFAVELRLRTVGKGGNIVQKGQARTDGGFWKVELNDGEPTCVFRGADGTTNAVRAREASIADGVWHTIRCKQSYGAVDLWVDGGHIGRNQGQTGHISNGHPLSIGGKQRCDQENVGCDYFSGTVDWIRITKG